MVSNFNNVCVCARALGWGEVSDRKGRNWVGEMIIYRFVFVKEDVYCYGLYVRALPQVHTLES